MKMVPPLFLKYQEVFSNPGDMSPFGSKMTVVSFRRYAVGICAQFSYKVQQQFYLKFNDPCCRTVSSCWLTQDPITYTACH